MAQKALLTPLCSLAVLAGMCRGVQASPVMGAPGLTASYRIAEPTPATSSVVETLSATLGSVERWSGAQGQWLQLKAVKRSSASFEAWLLCADYPSEALDDARAMVLRYILRQGAAEPVEFRHGVTDLAVLPTSGAWPHLLPRAASASTGTANEGPFPEIVIYLGHRYLREKLEHGSPSAPPNDAGLVLLRPDVLVGVPHNTRQIDETRRYDDSDYEYTPLTREDYETMISAGINCFLLGSRWSGCHVPRVPVPTAIHRPCPVLGRACRRYAGSRDPSATSRAGILPQVHYPSGCVGRV